MRMQTDFTDIFEFYEYELSIVEHLSMQDVPRWIPPTRQHADRSYVEV